MGMENDDEPKPTRTRPGNDELATTEQYPPIQFFLGPPKYLHKENSMFFISLK